MKHLVLLIFTFGLCIQSTCSQKTTTDVDSSQPKDDVIKVDEYTASKSLENYKTAVFAGGCFWCTEAVFHRIDGVVDVISGYAGGGTINKPNYKGVSAGNTPFAEAIYIYYDPAIIDYKTLLEVFWVGHHPTQLNRQGPDYGTQYRSAVFYQNEAQKEEVERQINELNKGNEYKEKIATTLEPYDLFWVAEAYHQDFYELNPNYGYVQSVSKPKVIKVINTFPKLLKKQYKSM